MSALTPEDLRIFEASMDIQNGGVSLFTEYYFGVELMPHQVLTAHATQTSVLTLGGRGSGKTFGWIFTYLWLATLMPDSRILWTSYTADQAAIAFYEVAMPYIAQSERFQKFLPEGMKSLKKKPYPQINLQIPGTNLPLSWIIFQPVDAHGSGDT
ncbi:MAG: hypothetical protein KDD84_24685, partial [Caldilineaceae bacterium]|nr:hypothetical protein [Caldilineaceae bacterium]